MWMGVPMWKRIASLLMIPCWMSVASGIPANTTCHNTRKRTREETVLSPAMLASHSVQGIRQRSSPPRVPAAPTSSSNVSDLTLTCQDGTVFQMAEFMKLMMEQLKTTNKVLSKGEESESSKRLRMAEAEVLIFCLHFTCLMYML